MWNSFYLYIEKKSTSRYSQFFLSIVAFIESIFFPIPPDVILIPLIHFDKKKFLRSVINCTLFSILGGAVGYFLGLFLFDSVKGIFDLSKQELFFNFYDQYGSFDYAWYLSVALSFFAAVVHLPIDEKPLPRLATT